MKNSPEFNEKEFPDIEYWNHRVMATIESDSLYFAIHEVYYDTNNTPILYTEEPLQIINDSIAEMKQDLEYMLTCLNHPILWTGDKFPQIYEK